MAAAQDIISGALRLIGAVATGEAPSAAELQDGRTALNALIESWSITPGLAPKSGGPLPTAATLTAALDLPDGYERALRYALAIDLAPEYGVEPSAAVVATARSSRAAVKRSNETDPPELTVEIMPTTGRVFGVLLGDE